MKRILLIGGDRRAAHLAELLEEDGFAVETLGLKTDENIHAGKADAALFPYPFSIRNGLIPTLTDERIRPEEALRMLHPDALVIAGGGMEAHESRRVKRYTDAAHFAKRNAQLSAEAAICEAMLHSRLALLDSRVLVTGYGLFGRELALRLKALGAEVWVAARREEQRLQAQKEGMRTVSIVEMAEILPEMDLILNTIPARIFGEYHLKRMHKECQILELASAPYGVDPEEAQRLGKNVAMLPGLPARYSPLSAAKALHEAVKELMGEGEA